MNASPAMSGDLGFESRGRRPRPPNRGTAMNTPQRQATRRQGDRARTPLSAPDFRRLRARAADVVALLRALSNPTRLLMLQQLCLRENSAAELQARTPTSQSVVSRQLRVLQEAGLVASRRCGRTGLYRLASPAAAAVIATLGR